jgi:hypothetical protein
MAKRYDWSFLSIEGVKEQIEALYREGGSPAVKKFLIEDLGQTQFECMGSDHIIRSLRYRGMVLTLSVAELSQLKKNVLARPEVALSRKNALKQAKSTEEHIQKNKASRATEEYKNKMYANAKREWSDPDYREKNSAASRASRATEASKTRRSIVRAELWADPDLRRRQTLAIIQAKANDTYPSAENWFADVGGIRSQFEYLLAEEGHKIAYETVFPGKNYHTVQSWFKSIEYDFVSLLVCTTWRSKLELSLESSFRDLGISVIHGTQTLGFYELDLYLPDYRVAIELNGFIYHTSVEQLTKDGKKFAGGPRYRTLHVEKADLCLSRGILPFQFWIDGDQGSDPSFVDQLKSFILYQLGLSLDKECPLLKSPFAPVEQESGYSYINRDLYPQIPSSEGISLVEGVYDHPKFGICYNSGFWHCTL